MNKYEKQKIMIEQLPNDFKMSDKQTLTLIRDLFEMIKDENKIIHLLDDRIKLLELKLKINSTGSASTCLDGVDP